MAASFSPHPRDLAIRTAVLLNPNAGDGDWSADRLGAALQDAGFFPKITDIKRSDPKRAIVALAAGGKTGFEKIAEDRRSFAQALREAVPRPYRLEVDGEACETELLMLEALAHGRTGPGLQLLPQPARPGRVGLFIVTPEHREPLLRWLETDAQGPAPGHVEQAREMRIEWQGAAPLRLDDEIQRTGREPEGLTLRGMDPDLLVPERGDAP